MPRVGCRQCSKRRITCDLGQPQCRKCVNKGLECSGYGFQYRFVENKSPSTVGPSQRSKPQAEPRKPILPNVETPANDVDEEIVSAGASRHAAREAQAASPFVVTTDHDFIMNDGDYSWTPSNDQLALSMGSPMIDLNLEIIRPGVSNLLSYFSTTIAPAWGFDEYTSNGYRDILLPLAFGDDLVQRAICVTSAFHQCITHDQPCDVAETGRSAIITKLTANMSSGNIDQVFNTSTWATLLVLLVCETVTGSTDFPYLYGMVMDIVQDGKAFTQSMPQLSNFLLEQTRMFQLLTPPFLSSEIGIKELQGSLDKYLGFLGQPEDFNPEMSPLVATYRYSFGLARDIYFLDAEAERQTDTINAKLAELRTLTEFISENTPGMHSLVWAYFIAGASSCQPDEREYFAGKMRQVYSKTLMKNILVALERLEDIWQHFPEGGWVSHVKSFRPVLAI